MRGDLPLTTSLLALTALCRAVMADPPHQQARSEALRPRAERRLRWRRRYHDVDPLRPAIAWTATAPALSKRLKSTIVPAQCVSVTFQGTAACAEDPAPGTTETSSKG